MLVDRLAAELRVLIRNETLVEPPCLEPPRLRPQRELEEPTPLLAERTLASLTAGLQRHLQAESQRTVQRHCLL